MTTTWRPFARRHRVARVQYQIQQNLLELRGRRRPKAARLRVRSRRTFRAVRSPAQGPSLPGSNVHVERLVMTSPCLSSAQPADPSAARRSAARSRPATDAPARFDGSRARNRRAARIGENRSERLAHLCASAPESSPSVTARFRRASSRSCPASSSARLRSVTSDPPMKRSGCFCSVSTCRARESSGHFVL